MQAFSIYFCELSEASNVPADSESPNVMAAVLLAPMISESSAILSAIRCLYVDTSYVIKPTEARTRATELVSIMMIRSFLRIGALRKRFMIFVCLDCQLQQWVSMLISTWLANVQLSFRFHRRLRVFLVLPGRKPKSQNKAANSK